MRRFATVAFAFSVVGLAAGCGGANPGPQSGPDQNPGNSTPAPVVSSSFPRGQTASPRPIRSPLPSPSPTGFSELVAVACNGRPTAEQVLAVLRRSTILPAGARPTVGSGPLCAGTWQYTVLNLPDHEPLRVVTRGSPEALTIETAGTEPCTARVKATAPAGILALLGC
jgi:hypothetical protein